MKCAKCGQHTVQITEADGKTTERCNRCEPGFWVERTKEEALRYELDKANCRIEQLEKLLAVYRSQEA